MQKDKYIVNFTRTYHVLAEDEEEAIQIARESHEDDISDSVKFDNDIYGGQAEVFDGPADQFYPINEGEDEED